MKRTILFNGPISTESVRRFIDDVLCTLGDDDELLILMHSPGGNVSQALCLARFLDSLPHHITTYNLSGVDSAAILLFAAGDTRLAAPQSGFFFHEASLQTQDYLTLRSLKRYKAELESDVRNITSYLEERTKRPAATWRRLMLQNTLLSASEAFQKGLVTDIDSSLSVHNQRLTTIFTTLQGTPSNN